MERGNKVISGIMLIGVLLAAAIMAVGTAVFLFYHWSDPTRDHIFRGEPQALRKPVDILWSALEGQDQSLIQLGALLLLINPLVRVAAALVSYALSRNFVYALFSAIVLCVLSVSFFL